MDGAYRVGFRATLAEAVAAPHRGTLAPPPDIAGAPTDSTTHRPSPASGKGRFLARAVGGAGETAIHREERRHATGHGHGRNRRARRERRPGAPPAPPRDDPGARRDEATIPAADAPAEAWAAFHARLGRPETPDGYVLDLPETLAEGVAPDDGLLARFRETAHGLGLLPRQAQGLCDWWLGENGAALAAAARRGDEATRDAETALREAWGARYDERLEQARRGALELGGRALLRHLEESGLGDDAPLLKALARAGEMLGEARADGAAPRDGFAGDAAAAKREIGRLRADAGFMAAYRDRAHAEHAAAMARMKDLFEHAYPGPAPG